MTNPTGNQRETCFGCGATVPATELPGHRYLGASPGCWAVYGSVLVKEYGEWRNPPIHRLTVDAYSAQHPGTPSPQTIQSAAVHLIGLFVAIELGEPPSRAIEAVRRAADQSNRFYWLQPPATLGELTIVDVARAITLPDHEQVVRRWAQCVWHAWRVHHPTIREWGAG